jgi:hypothetical protein
MECPEGLAGWRSPEATGGVRVHGYDALKVADLYYGC